jgi:hypothetical protein
MVIGVVGLSRILFDDDPFRIPRATFYFWIHIVLAIAAWGKAALAILKCSTADISRKSVALMLLNGPQELFGYLWRELRGSMRLSIRWWRG